MTEKNPEKTSRLVQALREAVDLVQMIVFKELRDHLQQSCPDPDQTQQSLLAGAITNEIFGTPNPEPRFAEFREKNRADIEQALIELHNNHTALCPYITDALRIQMLCNSLYGREETATLEQAKEYGYLIESRDIPLPSTFITSSRELGKSQGLIDPPRQNTSEKTIEQKESKHEKGFSEK
ncbi:MAG: hypothetical protein CSA20_05410 [Deltaproteobacteria bacterium]|nr:MAG: hypothetical protein CSA20_05410 [Deltaproteobacteria bacterium]